MSRFLEVVDSGLSLRCTALRELLLSTMAAASAWAKIESVFQEAAIELEGNSVKELVHPGVAGLEVLIGGEFGSERVSSEVIKGFFDQQEWEESRSLSWEDIRAVLLFLELPELKSGGDDDAEKDEVQGDEICEEMGEQVADLSDTIQLSFDSGRFRHRMEGNSFLPLIPAPTFENQQERDDAFKAYDRMQSHLIPEVDTELWNDWTDRKEVAELMEENVADAFQDYLRKNYVSILSIVVRRQEIISLGFVPKVAPEVEKNPEVRALRQKLLQTADSDDENKAQEEVKRLYVEYVASKSEDLQRKLPSVVPDRFWVLHYYDCLQKAVEQRMHGTDTAPRGPSSSKQQMAVQVKDEGCKPATASTQVSIQEAANITGIDALLAGQGFAETNQTAEVLKFMSSVEILESSTEKTKCKYQGALVFIDKEPRSIKKEPASPSKKRGGDFSEDNKAIDCVLVDRTGPILLTVFGGLAVELSHQANELEAQKSRGVNVHRFIEVDKARIVSFLKNDWNGQLLTQLRMLQTVRAAQNESGSTVRFLPQGATAGLTSASFRVPSMACCISTFSSLGDKLTAPFRGTFHGFIMDVLPLDHTHSGNPKLHFS